MLNFSRLSQLLSWTWHKTPRWYLLINFGACAAISIIIYFIFGETGRELDSSYGRRILSSSSIYYGFAWANILSLIPMAAHFVSRHYRDSRQTIDYLTLPVAGAERYLVLFLGLFVAIPLLGLLSNYIFFALLNALPTNLIWPYWKWMIPLFNQTMVPYLLAAIPLFALGLLRSRLTVLWAGGIAIGFFALFAGSHEASGIRNIQFPATSLGGGTTATDLFGPQLTARDNFGINAFEGLLDPSFYVPGVVIAGILFFTSAWLALNRKEA
ncbi:MAG: hypothetical protein AAF828_06100 [Bacteroidota bacterium]